MDKHQAAKNYVWSLRKQVGPQSYTDAEINAFEAGWEAHEAQQSTSDAVAFAVWLDNERNKRPVTLWNDVQIWGKENAFQLMYALFNPSGAAPQADCPKSNAVSKEQKINIIWKVIEYFQEVRLNDEKCQDMDLWNDVVLSYNDVEVILYEMLEEIDPKADHKKPSSPPAGPVWVKETTRVPDHYKNIHIRYNVLHFGTPIKASTTVRYIPSTNKWLKQNSEYLKDYTDLEWLDESAPTQQVFTREQVQEIVKEAWYANYGLNDVQSSENDSDNEAIKWFDTNYPLTK